MILPPEIAEQIDAALNPITEKIVQAAYKSPEAAIIVSANVLSEALTDAFVAGIKFGHEHPEVIDS